jgi:hypothetical protein
VFSDEIEDLTENIDYSIIGELSKSLLFGKIFKENVEEFEEDSFPTEIFEDAFESWRDLSAQVFKGGLTFRTLERYIPKENSADLNKELLLLATPINKKDANYSPLVDQTLKIINQFYKLDTHLELMQHLIVTVK